MTSIMSFLIETLMGVTPPLWRYSCLEMMYSLTRDQKKPWSRREVTDQMRFGLTYHIITLESNMERVSSLGVKLKCPPVDVTSPQVICIVVAGHARHNGPLNKYICHSDEPCTTSKWHFTEKHEEMSPLSPSDRSDGFPSQERIALLTTWRWGYSPNGHLRGKPSPTSFEEG